MKGKHLNIFNKYFNFDTLNFYIRYSFMWMDIQCCYLFVLNREESNLYISSMRKGFVLCYQLAVFYINNIQCSMYYSHVSRSKEELLRDVAIGIKKSFEK